MTHPLPESPVIAVIGLGYVGLPLAVEFGKQYPTIGFDLNQQRIAQLQEGTDITQEITDQEISAATHLSFSAQEISLAEPNIYIVTVPTPVDKQKRPNLSALKKASETVGRFISKGDIVIYESTVYPGATEEVCIPIIENKSGLSLNESFFAGYSPERINPGDNTRRLTQITKVTSGSTPEVATYIDELYNAIITAGTHKAESIKIAEAAKVIENTQRDLNIALVNELAIIFDKLDIDTKKVLEAAGTKWNFLPFSPGLVGGHCIGVDPYYLTHKAQEIGYLPEVILAGRRINDSMGAYIVSSVVKLIQKKKIHASGANVLVLGLAFKENCPDIRNSKVVDVINELHDYHANVDVYDPWVNPDAAKAEYNIDLIADPKSKKYDAIILAVAQKEFVAWSAQEIKVLCKPESVIYDVKSVWPEHIVDGRL